MGALQHFEGLSDSWLGPERSQSPGEETSSEGHRQRSSFAVLHTVESHTEHHLERTGVVCENADAKLICIFSPWTHTHFYLSWDSVSWSLPLKSLFFFLFCYLLSMKKAFSCGIKHGHVAAIPRKHRETSMGCRVVAVYVCVAIRCLELVLLINMCVTKTKCSKFPSLIVSQPVVFGLTWNKSRSRTRCS